MTAECPPLDVRAAAWFYLEHGFQPVPVTYRGKKALGEGWQNLRSAVDTLDELFPEAAPRNIGLLLGEGSAGLIDIDLDAAEAVAVAPSLLPRTSMIHGRPSKQCSHYW